MWSEVSDAFFRLIVNTKYKLQVLVLPWLTSLSGLKNDVNSLKQYVPELRLLIVSSVMFTKSNLEDFTRRYPFEVIWTGLSIKSQMLKVSDYWLRKYIIS
ncbi:hypothetical protein HK098_001592 [Nowakowskiella sp. JEL0407]|nr:hypothetical protein HK098_001592 [Nowakowskiella sp. JEL0407]